MGLDVVLLPLLLGAVFWFLILRPARNRQRQLAGVQSRLAPGARVMIGSGLHATVTGLDDDTVLLEVADGVVCRYARAAVVKVIEPAPGPALDAPAPTEQPPAT